MNRPQSSDPLRFPTARRADARGTAPAKPARPCRSVLMVGTDLSAQGGIRAVVKGYVDAGIFDRIECRYVGTHRDGSIWTKVRAALTGWAQALHLMIRMDAPLVHLHTASRASFWRKSLVALLAQALRRPYVLHIHGGEFIPFFEQQPALVKRFMRYVVGNAARVIALSEPARAAILKHFEVSAIDVVPNGVAIPPSPVKRGDTAPTLLFLGHLQRAKGTFDLIHAFARIAERYPDLKLVCAGSGRVAQARAQAERLGILDRVSFPGWVDKQGRDRALASATIFVLPSYVEGLPMALLEAMSCGLPVVATPVGGIPNLIEHDVNGVLVRPGQIDLLAAALSALLADPQKQELFGRAARQTVQAGYDIESTMQKLYAIYERFGVVARAEVADEEPVKIMRSVS